MLRMRILLLKWNELQILVHFYYCCLKNGFSVFIRGLFRAQLPIVTKLTANEEPVPCFIIVVVDSVSSFYFQTLSEFF